MQPNQNPVMQSISVGSRVIVPHQNHPPPPQPTALVLSGATPSPEQGVRYASASTATSHYAEAPRTFITGYPPPLVYAASAPPPVQTPVYQIIPALEHSALCQLYPSPAFPSTLSFQPPNMYVSSLSYPFPPQQQQVPVTLPVLLPAPLPLAYPRNVTPSNSSPSASSSGMESFSHIDSNRAVIERRQLIVKFVTDAINDAQLQSICEQFGCVEHSRIVYDRATGRTRGYAFVTYTTAEDAARAVRGLTGMHLHGRYLAAAITETSRKRAF